MLSLKNTIIFQTPEKMLNKLENYPLLLKNNIEDIAYKIYKYYYDDYLDYDEDLQFISFYDTELTVRCLDKYTNEKYHYSYTLKFMNNYSNELSKK